MVPSERKRAVAALRSLEHPVFLAVKAALASGLALSLDRIAGNPDHVSSTFVAVLCVSPTVLMGLRRATSQMVGSLLGGGAGTLALLAGLPTGVGVPLAVGLAVGLAFAVRLPMGYPVAAFTALFVQLVHFGVPTERLEVRLFAIVIAGVSGFAVNVVVSSRAYDAIFARKARIVERSVLASLGPAVAEGPDAVQPIFAALGDLKREMDLAVEELRWRRNRSAAALVRHRQHVRRLRQILHVASEVGYLCRERCIDTGGLDPFVEWLAERRGPAPPVPEPVEAAVERLLRGLRRMGLDASTEPSSARPGI